MSRPHSLEHCLSDEFTALVRYARERQDAEARLALFAALLDLERRAGLAEVPDPLLRQITEARFLAGILRDCVVPVSRAGLRSAQRALSITRRRGADDDHLDAIGAAQG
jgi:hypothetical protein